MTAAIDEGAAAPAAALLCSGRPIATAVLVGLLVAGTLGTISSIIVGTGLHLLGLPGAWAFAAAVVTAAASLVPSAAFARQAWRIERDGIES